MRYIFPGRLLFFAGNPAAITGAKKVNYTRIWEASAPIQTLTDLQSRTVSDVKQTTEYTDGFGRTIQVVGKQLSPSKKDIVTARIYDSVTGNEVYKYLPFTADSLAITDAAADGSLKMDAFQEQGTFYNSQMSAAGQTGEYNIGAGNLNWAYSQLTYDNSPLNRVIGTFQPGSSFVGAARGATGKLVVNTATDNVQIWNIAAAQGSLPVIGGVYAAGALFKSIATDEAGHQVIQYTDKDEHVILTKAQYTATSDAGAGSDHAGWLCTYYVYDDYNNLRFVITPKAIQLIYSPVMWGSITQVIADELCYRYEYDLFNRVVIRKSPGTPTGAAGEVWMVYDQRNRLVMQQDGNLRAGKQWSYIQYDALDRPVTTGIITDNTNYLNLSYHANLAATSIAYPNPASYPNELLSQTHYDDYTGMTTTTTSTLTATLDASTNGAGNTAFTTTYNTSPSYAQPITKNTMTRGKITWKRIEAIGGSYTANSKYVYAVNFYDNKGRGIQTQSINITGAQDINTTQYDFSGKVLTSVLSHHLTNGTANQTHIAVEHMSYDHTGRLLTITRSLATTFSGGTTVTTPAVTIVSNTYNDFGKVSQKKIGQQRDASNNPTATPIETQTYDYTIQGWLSGINRAYLSPGYTIPAGGGNYFGMELGYDKTPSVAGRAFAGVQYDGSITGVSWKSKGDAVDRQYNYQYDGAKRLTAANFIQNTSGSTWDSSFVNFSENGLTYDYNGNITSLNRKGFQVGGSVVIDQLTYTYTANTNRLQNVIDAANNPITRLGDFRTSQTYLSALGVSNKTVANAASYTDYTYDPNGNVLKDLNKDIGTATTSGIVYNYLNLPKQITTTKGTIQYIYDADGNKIQKITTENNATVTYNGTAYSTSITTTTTYINGFVYKTLAYGSSNLLALNYTYVLQFSSHEEGRIRFLPAVGSIPASYVFDNFILDNLGNIRMVLTDEKQTDVYPAATMEGGVAGLTGSTTLIYNEAAYYSFNNHNDITATATVGGVASPIPWFANATNSAYFNYNGSSATGSPVNTNPNLNSNGNNTNHSSYVYRLNPALNAGDNNGLAITLKVMAGDQISIFGKSAWHNPTGGAINNSTSLVSSALTTFLQSFASTAAVVASTHGTVTGALLNNSATTTPLSTILTTDNSQTSTGTAQPVKAGINWILFDDQFRPVQTGSGYDAVSTGPDNVKTHALVGLPSLTMPRNGFLYVYCSNESNMDVVFDNLQVINTRGAIVEETHLYADGLVMAGISDRAWNKLQNSYHYQSNELESQEFSDGTGLEEYDFAARFYDPQLGVWHSQDPESQYASPYTAMGNNWVNGRDPNGKFFLEFAIGFISGYLSSAISTGNWGWKSLKAGLIGGLGAIAGMYLGTAVTAALPTATMSPLESELIGNVVSSSIIGGANSEAFGNGNIWQGLYAGALSGIVSTDLSQINYSKGDWARLGENFAVGGISGGFISKQTGGNFWAGAAGGAASATLSNIPYYKATIEDDVKELAAKLHIDLNTPTDLSILEKSNPAGLLLYTHLTAEQFWDAYNQYAANGTGNILADLVDGSDIKQLSTENDPGDFHFKVGNLHFRSYCSEDCYGQIPYGYSVHVDNYNAAINPIIHLLIDTIGQARRGFY